MIMKFMKFSLGIWMITALVLLVPSVSLSATQALKTSMARGYSHLMCDAHAAQTVCDSGSSDIFAIVDGYDSLTFFFYETGSGASCDIYATGLREGSITSSTDLSTFGANKVNATALSATLDKVTLSGVDFKYVWISCPVINANTVTVEMIGSVGDQRVGR